LSLHVLSSVAVAVGVKVGALPVFEPLVPHSLVAVSILPGVHTVAMRLGLQPLANIRLAF
jgi:hypothetical protein